MKRLQRIGSFLFALLMLCSLMAALPVYAVAEAVAITEVAFTVEAPLLGADAVVIFSVPEDAPYTVIAECDWLLGNQDEVETIEEVDCEYGTTFYVEAKEGYTLTADTTVAIDGAEGNIALLGGDDSPTQNIEFTCDSRAVGTVSTIDLTDVPTAAVGDRVEPYTFSNELYTAVGHWYTYDYEAQQYVILDEGSTVTDSGIYRLAITVTAVTGFVLDDSLTVTINGEERTFSGHDDTTCDIECITVYADSIDEITLDEALLPKPVIGKKYTAEPFKIAVPEDEPYTVAAYWTCESDGATEGTFEKGKAYTLYVTVYPKAGYALEDTVYIQAGEMIQGAGTENKAMATITLRETLATIVDEAEITGLPTLKVGDTFPDEPIELTVPKDAPYTAYGEWYDGEIDYATGKAADGSVYYLSVTVQPKDGYEFSDDTIVKLDGVGHADWVGDATWLSIDKVYSFCDGIDEIEITTNAQPKAGEPLSDDYFSVPKDANYTLMAVNWINWATREFVEVFQEGDDHVAFLMLEANEGYAFADDTEIWIDGELYDIGVSSPKSTTLTKNFFSGEIITEVHLENVPQFAIGKTAESGVTTPADAPYRVSMGWERCIRREPFDGVFEEGVLYSSSINILPADGYRFDETTKVFLNGVEYEGPDYNGTSLCVEEVFGVGFTEITRVELTVTPPAVGDHASIAPVVAITVGENVGISGEKVQAVWIAGDLEDNTRFEGYFREGKTYGVQTNLIADEGYVFAEDVTVIVNGTVLSGDYYSLGKSYGNVTYFFDARCQHLLSGWEEDGAEIHVRSCTVCDHTETEKHAFGEWQIGSKGKEGTHTRVCEACEYVESEKHAYSDWETADGDTEKRKCTVCGDEQTREAETTTTTTDNDTTLSPDTGVKSKSWLWIVLAVAAAVCVAALLLTRKKNGDR